MSSLPPDETYSIASVALTGILIVPLSVLWIVSFVDCRRYGDHARQAFTWMKVAYPLITLALMCYVALNAIQIAFFTTTTTTAGFYSLEQAQSRLSDVGGLFESTGNIFLLLCLVDLGLGFLHVLNNHRTGHIIARGVTAGLGFILFVLAAVTYGWQEDILTRYYTSNYDTENATISIIRISCAFDILLWIASLAVTALSIHVFLVSQRNVRLQRIATLFLVSGIIYLLRNTWEIAGDIKWWLNNFGVFVPIYFEAVNPILDYWSTFVVLVLVFVIGCQKDDGLWSTEQALQNAKPQPIYVNNPGYYP